MNSLVHWALLVTFSVDSAALTARLDLRAQTLLGASARLTAQALQPAKEAPRVAGAGDPILVTQAQPAQAPAKPEPKDRAEWQQLLMSEIARSRKYPTGSVQRNEEGTATIRFKVERTGKLIDYSLVASSGFPELDDEALALIKRAQLPPFASTMAESELQFTVPIKFGLWENAEVKPGQQDQVEWRRLLLEEVARSRKYPTGSARRNEEGTATIRFKVDRSGKLLERSLVTSSGFPELDDEALALIKRVRIPPFASTMAEAELQFTLPIRFGRGETGNDVEYGVQSRLQMYVRAALWLCLILAIASLVTRLNKRKVAAVGHDNTQSEILASAQDAVRGSSYLSNTFIARHWRGEFPLWVSYWIVGLCANLSVLTAIALSFAIFGPEQDYYPPAVFASVVMIWMSVLGVSIWQSVGVWRSANRRAAARAAQNRKAFWARAAQTAVVLGALGGIASFTRQGLPQIAEAYSIAFQDDPGIPPYSIAVLRGGAAAEIVGGLKYGLTGDFEKLLNEHPMIKTVHLDSVGGRVGEGEKLFQLIRKRGLDTHVDSECLSACTLAFAGGRRRYLDVAGVLGFHRGTFAGMQEPKLDTVQRRVFRAAGFDSGFITRALSTPNEDIWTPPIETLVRARVVTDVDYGSMFDQR